MHFILVGGTGYLGSYIAREIQARGMNATVAHRGESLSWSWAGPGLKSFQFDMTDDNSIQELCDYSSTIEDDVTFIMLAAMHHPDKVEEEFNLAWHINITQLSKFVNSIPANADCVYVSTDNVYGGGAPYHRFKEEDDCVPVNAYGRQKLLAESVVNGHGYNVVRCPFLIGPSITSKPHFYDHIKNAFERNEVFELFSDSYRSALTFEQVAQYIVQLQLRLSGQYWGCVNLASDEAYSKYDVGVLLAERLDLDKGLAKAITMEGSDIFSAKRQRVILMDNSKHKLLLGLNSVTLEL